MRRRRRRRGDGRGWSPREQAAAPIANGPISEVSVPWNAYLGKWLMLYLDEERGAVVLWTAKSLTGSWSPAQIVARGTDYPGLYGTYLHPWSTGSDLYFTMSQWDPYNVFLMRTKLTR
ncbi:DUF4185 domain-containing protein [Kribbella sandramycini]|uniref:DUF4185 domain-containing protein n=1 Tax=Kribbella sandramycini TaxID=60450 RepID=UPI001EE23DB2|nr:DUF4185 domain-containing protein [Kribbella sandramycini]